MREMECDVAVIGAGTAGIAAHKAALEAGARSVLIEQGPGGTTCARVGCMPSKLLITAAAVAREAREASTFGIETGSVRIDGRAVMERVRYLRDSFVGSVFEGLDDFPQDSRVAGRAVFEDGRTLRIDDGIRLRFRAAVIATGSNPSVPEALRPLGARALTTDTLFEIDDLPASIAVLGAGPVGIELAQALARLGARTTLFDPSGNIGGLGDPDLCAAAREILGKALDLRLGTKVEHGEIDGDGVRVDWSREDGGSGQERFDRVLAAAGRPPNVTCIGLERTGLELDDKGSPAFDPRSLACRGAPFFIAGDANQDRPVLHEASRQGRIAGRNAAAIAAGSEGERPERWVNLALVFTDPQIALVGQTYDAEAAGDWLVGTMNFCDQGRARVMARDQGGVRIYADRWGRLLGAEMVGPEVEHLAHILAYAIGDGHTAQSLADRPHYHPTLEEGLGTALADIVSQTAG